MLNEILNQTITSTNNRYNSGGVTKEEYTTWKQDIINKLDIFLACNRITSEQYEALNSAILTV